MAGTTEPSDAGRTGRAADAERFLDLSVDLMAVVDFDARLLEVSSSWERSLGWTASEVVGTSMFDLFHPDDLGLVHAALGRVLGGEQAQAIVVRVRAKDGSYRHFQSNARADGELSRIFVTASDVTDRMALEEALRRQIDLEELVAGIAARLIGVEPDQILREIEAGMGELARALGADRAHLLRGGRHSETMVLEWLDPVAGQRQSRSDPHPDVERWWQDRLRAGQLLRVDDVGSLDQSAPLVADALRGDGVQSVVLVPLPSRRGHWGFLALVAIAERVHFSDDATALLRLAGECFMAALGHRDDSLALSDARRELQHRNEELERANEELERFAYVAAHDLKAPLARVEMALSAFRSGADPATGEVLLDVASRSAKRMGQLIEDLLAFASVGTTIEELAVVDLDELVGTVLADLAARVEARGARIERAALGRVIGHESLLRQLLQNLLDNAIKFGRDGVDLVVGIGADRRDGGVEIEVVDNGIGIDPQHRHEVFGVFTRLNSTDVAEGSGIGLATCAKVVAHHHGRIWVDDGVDGGIAVRVWLPQRGSGPLGAQPLESS